MHLQERPLLLDNVWDLLCLLNYLETRADAVRAGGRPAGPPMLLQAAAAA